MKTIELGQLHEPSLRIEKGMTSWRGSFYYSDDLYDDFLNGNYIFLKIGPWYGKAMLTEIDCLNSFNMIIQYTFLGVGELKKEEPKC